MNLCQYFIPKVCAHPLEEEAMWKMGRGLPFWCIFSCNARAPSLGIARLLGKILLPILNVLMQAICLHNPCKIWSILTSFWGSIVRFCPCLCLLFDLLVVFCICSLILHFSWEGLFSNVELLSFYSGLFCDSSVLIVVLRLCFHLV